MIHKFKQFGFNIVLDVNSGAVHLVDELTFKMLNNLHSEDLDSKISENLFEKFKEIEKSDLEERFNELVELKLEGLLFSKDCSENFKNKIEEQVLKAMCLNVAHDCNLRCEYCFASTGNFGEERSLMSCNVAAKAIDFLIEHSEKRHNLEVDFFGGEPLLNLDVVKKTVEYARKIEKKHDKNFRFTITTNGILLDEKDYAFLNEQMSNVVLSLDGRKEVNDRMRKTAKNSGTYDILIPKFSSFIKSRGNLNYNVRGTFTKFNLDFSKDALHFFDLGFKNVSIEPVACNFNESYAISEEDLPKILEEYEKLALEIIKRRKNSKDCNFFHFNIDLDQGPCIVKRIRGCGCAGEYVAVSPSGNIYPCHQFVGLDEFKLGSINEGLKNLKLKDQFKKIDLLNKKECLKCWAKFYCSGGCSANNFKFNGNLLQSNEIFCAMEKKRIECAIAIKAALN